MAGLYDAFYILFKSLGAAEVIKDEKQVEKAGDSLQKKLGGVDKTLQSVGAEFVNMGRQLAGVAAGALSAAAIFQSLKSSINYTQELSKTSNLLGVNIEDLDAWGRAITKAGGSAASFQSSLHSLAQHFGTSPRVALQALLPLADAFHRLGRFRALQYGKRLGLDESTILLLQRGRREVSAYLERQRELGVVTKRDQEITDRYTLALADSEHAFTSLARVVATDALPVLTRFFNLAATPAFEYLTQHKDLITGAFLAIGGAAALLAAPFIAANAAVIGVTAAVVALISAFALVFEDIKKFNEGQDSFIGRHASKSSLAYKAFRPKEYEGFEGLGSVQNLLHLAGSSPIGAQTSNSIANNLGGDKNTTVNVQEVNVITQATDPVGVREEILKGLAGHFWQSNNQFANGQAY